MGYRSTFVTTDNSLKLPTWFMDKWGSHIHVGKENTLPISSRYEAKTYGLWLGLESDIQRAIKEDGRAYLTVHIVFMGEDGALSKSEISADTMEGIHITKND